MPYVSRAQEKYFNANRGRLERQGVDVDEWNRASKGRKLPARAKKKKIKPTFIVNNKLKAYGQMDTKTNVVEVNRKKHKGDKNELADTVRHELLHVKHPKAHEKTIQKMTEPPISRAERDKLIAKLRMKKLNYKAGAIKRSLRGAVHKKTAPGEIFNQAKTITKERLAIMGMV